MNLNFAWLYSCCKGGSDRLSAFPRGSQDSHVICEFVKYIVHAEKYVSHQLVDNHRANLHPFLGEENLVIIAGGSLSQN